MRALDMNVDSHQCWLPYLEYNEAPILEPFAKTWVVLKGVKSSSHYHSPDNCLHLPLRAVISLRSNIDSTAPDAPVI